MNAFAMKLESRQLLTATNEEKFKNLSSIKKCKRLKKRDVSSNRDKDALVNNDGLGRQFCDENELNCKNVTKTYESSKENHLKKMSLKSDKMFSESDKIQERLQRSLNNEDKEKVMSILNEIKALSDIEKLFLYLQLPTGTSFEVDPFKQKNLNPLGKKADEEGLFAVTWIQSHLEEDPDVSLPKQEVYDEYQTYCSLSGTDPLCAADFGKVMKQIFPSVKPRRLGTRGNSRYCYSGLRKKLKLAPPSVPDLQKEKESSSTLEENESDEVTSAACHLLFEWAEKLLGIKFTSLKELAIHLLQNMYVDNRSVAAFTVLLDASPQLLSKGLTTNEGGIKKTEAQFHLQRKLQEKELIKEQKRKLQEQRSNNLSVNKIKGLPTKKRVKSRKARFSPDDFTCDEEKPVVDIQDSKVKDKLVESREMKKCKEILYQMQDSEIALQSLDVINIKTENSFTKSSTGESDTDAKVSEVPLSRASKSPLSSPSSSLGETDDSVKKKNSISPKIKPPVCISQSLSGILIVPSLPQISSDIGKQNGNSPKYKRIQPKPLQRELFNTVARARAGSVGSCLPLKPKSRSNDGRRSSYACLQSDSLIENGEEKSQKFNSAAFLKEIPENSPKDVRFQTSATSENIININGKDVSLEKSKLPIKPRLIIQSGLQVNNLSQIEDNNSNKRHLEENDELTKNKRVHLESSSESRWIPKTGISNSNSILKVNTNKHIGYEEVNVHEIEGDALNDYFRGTNNPNSINLSQQNELEQQISSNNKVQQLSQLRMLLEQNLPSAISKTTMGTPKTNKVSKSVDTNENLQSSLSEDVGFQDANKVLLSNTVLDNSLTSDNTLKNDLQLESFTLDKLLSSNCLTSDTEVNMNNQMLSDPSMFLNCTQDNIQDMDITLQNELNQNPNTDDILLTASLLTDADLINKQTPVYGRVNTYTQVPSVPQSPNTRRRAFNFMPISPRHTPIPDGIVVSGTPSVSSPHMRMMMSTGVGPSQPPSNSGSPFVSPRSTPVPLSRSRHSSGQSTYSTSCHTPFQNFDSGVSSVSSSPFISPQPTPVPVSRLRHNSSHASNKTVTFSSVNSPQVMHPHSASSNIRTRHNSGPGAHHLVTSPLSSLSPLVAEQPSTQSFVFPSTNELRSRHSSGSNATTPLSPVSEQASSSSSCASNIPDLSAINDASQSFLNDGAGDLLISANPSCVKQVRHRHVSGSVIYGKSSYSQQDIFSQEIQKLLKNSQNSGASDLILSNRSQSVPLHQMLQTADGLYFLQSVEDSCPKSQPSTPVMNQIFSFPTLNSNSEASTLTLTMDVNNQEKSVNQNSQMEWNSLESSAELDANSARRNLAILYDATPLSDDLQTTLEDLRDCDTDFSKLELELRQTDENVL